MVQTKAVDTHWHWSNLNLPAASKDSVGVQPLKTHLYSHSQVLQLVDSGFKAKLNS